MKLKTIFLLSFLFVNNKVSAQFFDWFSGDKSKVPTQMLLNNREIQIKTTDAINDMYNFRFFEAERGFKWLTIKYPEHPIGYFLVGLNTWWKIVPDTKVAIYDDKCHEYMDISIEKAEKMLDIKSVEKEAAFFLAVSYAFKGRLYSERSNWVKAAWAGKQSLRYLEKSRGDGDLNPELIFGDGIYNYYSKWIHETYPKLKPLLTFFRKGDKQKGIQQLEYVSQNAFYTRMEARYFLVQIYAMEGNTNKGLTMARMMHSLYPNNSFFHRYVARFAFQLGQLAEAERYANEILARLNSSSYGYGNNDGRYACYILGYVNQHYHHDMVLAKMYYDKTIGYAVNNDSEDSGYSLSSHLQLGKMAEEEKDYSTAAKHYKNVIDNADKKIYASIYKEAVAKDKALKIKMKASKKS